MNKKETKFKETEIGEIPEEYPLKEIGIGAKVFSGFAFKSDDLKDNEGIPVVKIGNIHNRQVTLEGSQFFPEKLVNDKISKFFLVDRDVLIAMTGQGSVGRVGQIRLQKEKVLLNQRVGKFIIDNKNLDGDYLYFVISSPRYETILFDTGSGSGQPNLSPSQILSVEIPFPDIKIQRKISDILRSLNDKIYLNKQINKTLEAMGQVIFKRWFVDFEFPNEDGEPYKSSGGEMVDSELGEIPKGWKVSKIGDEFETILGGTPSTINKSYWENGTIPWINSGEVNEFRITEPTTYITEEALSKSATKLIPKGTTVLAITGATLGQVSRLEIDACANQSVIGIIESKNIRSEYIYFWIKNTIEEIIRHQTGGAQQHINKNNVNLSKILIPSDKLLQEYQRAIKPIFDNISLACFEIQNLSKIRDSLLPKLMSGKIRVPVEVKT